MRWIKKYIYTFRALARECKATEMVEGDWTGLNTVKYMISLLLWIISIDLCTVQQHSLIKAVWNKPEP